ncbi:MAG: nucleotidyl transferase AbiEii/AbiGii toxin family protein [Candidatus Woesearchaeota archaeon]
MELGDLRRLAAKEELSLNYIAKDEMISKALFFLQGFDKLILKGGTAINKVYLKNKRFSEDIDLDLIFKGTVKQAVPKTQEIVSRLKGFNIAKPRIMKETIRYDLFFTNLLNHKDRIMLEFTVKKKAMHFSKKIVNFGFVPYESSLLNVYDLEEIIRQKINCVINRLEGKDFFDLYYLLELLHKPARLGMAEKEKILKKIALEEKEIRGVANVINHYIPRNQRPNWDIFLEELKGKIQAMPIHH